MLAVNTSIHTSVISDFKEKEYSKCVFPCSRVCSLGFGAFESMETRTWRRANQVAITFPVTQFKSLGYFMEVE